ncbi:MAG: ABC transporter permease [Deltaproteobacteria bacterium]|nr:ABC transporter permease [Deltaproteobacteria bacterium]
MRFTLHRSASGLLVLVGVALLVFSMIHLVPGDPVDALLGETAPAVERERMRHALHLDESLGAQFRRFARSIADGTLGHSFRQPNRTVSSLIGEVFPLTIELALASMLVAILLALPLGMAAAYWPHGPIDFAATGVSLLGISIPNMYLGPILLMIFYLNLGWLPGPAPADPSSLAAVILPAITLGTAMMAMLTRMTRLSMLDALSQDYIRTARAKGLGSWSVVVRHGLPNALIPVITVAGLQFGALLSGAIITEKVFARPGIGTLLLEGISTRDFPVIQGCVLVISMSYVLVNALTDIAYGLADPRIKERGRA